MIEDAYTRKRYVKNVVNIMKEHRLIMPEEQNQLEEYMAGF